jgi:hypothetical protein
MVWWGYLAIRVVRLLDLVRLLWWPRDSNGSKRKKKVLQGRMQGLNWLHVLLAGCSGCY